ncbi:response regulator [Streptomonospora nanhaiensis]|uniref:DNA-binding NarL/FixJ family response regulator n=1 Tax=Streptomonospora nanhaiensis TaxID=1323731 RepID=A0A853BIL3_9ACTN|nr:response regulator transcription factor [Streptomonospora nanhaiensis]MBV2363141.1 response regulator transcription factor [Streptomonospora nanhaiensis]MBX9389239.1 response regulator transcription factor [Streptomonospora nanhaiensis]NYI94366.1 DNA-binding NarL/FixJ family response regulator [Streptomonospora nanhaiensis]
MIRVALVDDEDLIRAGLRALIAAEPDLEVVAEEADGAGVVDMARRHRPDVVLMDVRMPGLDGIEATRALLRRLDDPPTVVVLTTFENDDYVYGALRAGASGFLLKRSRPEDILDAVRLVARGDSVLFPAAIRRLAAALAPEPGPQAGRIQTLTEREAATLRLMARGMSNAEIAAALVVGVETVKTHVSNILAKLGVRDRTQAVVAAYDCGLIRPGADAR